MERDGGERIDGLCADVAVEDEGVAIYCRRCVALPMVNK